MPLAVVPVSHSLHLVGTVDWIEISSGGDAGLGSVGRVAVTATELVVGVVVVPKFAGTQLPTRFMPIIGSYRMRFFSDSRSFTLC